jgi:DnaJ-class molecular chaperone
MCSECQGEKTQSRTRRIDVRIPAGVKAGSKVRVTKEGGRGYDGGEPGDLYLVIQIESEPASASTASSGQKSDLDTRADVSLTVTQAVLGCSLEVQTPQGPISMIIPPLTPSGKVFRLRNQGSRSGDLKGDHYVTVGITMPSTITPKERELYQELHHLAIERDTSQYTDS